jgi:hypothetical protein
MAKKLSDKKKLENLLLLKQRLVSRGEPIIHSKEDQEEGKEIWGGEKSWENS